MPSLAVFHTSMQESGCQPLPAGAPFRVAASAPPLKPRGLLLGYFGAQGKPTHVVVVNLDYTTEINTALAGPTNLESFDAANAKWSPVGKSEMALHLLPGGCRLVRVAQ